jgi:hypothetical protein
MISGSNDAHRSAWGIRLPAARGSYSIVQNGREIVVWYSAGRDRREIVVRRYNTKHRSCTNCNTARLIRNGMNGISVLKIQLNYLSGG